MGKKMKRRRVAFYVRVSKGSQSLENQKRELRQAAKSHGWEVVQIYQDKSSGARKEKRPGYLELMRVIQRRGVDLVAAWSTDRISRSLRDLMNLLGELQAKDVDLYLHTQGIDTKTPGGRALFAMFGMVAELELNQIRERIIAGQDRARAEGKKFGRPRIPDDKEKAVRASLARAIGVARTARDCGVGVSAVQRIKREIRAKS